MYRSYYSNIMGVNLLISSHCRYTRWHANTTISRVLIYDRLMSCFDAVIILCLHRSSTTTYVVSGVGIMGVMLQQCINVAIILNYGTQCEMVILYTHGICLRLHEKSQELRTTMHVRYTFTFGFINH